MLSLKQLSLYLFSLVLLVTACREELVEFIPDSNSTFPSEQVVEASFYGRLLNDAYEPLADTEVWVGDRMTLTDSLGDWTILHARVVGRQAYIRSTAEGHFSTSRVLSVAAESNNLVQLMAVRKGDPTRIQAASGGEVIMNKDGRLSFEPESFVDQATGRPYSGEVLVYTHEIDGRSAYSSQVMPGRLESTLDQSALISFGMVAVELESPGGEPLQLAEGSSAALSLAQEASNASAPDTIPLWYFDEDMGTWAREGYSVREGNRYVGKVEHFSWWNCDWPGPPADFCIQFTCEEPTDTTLPTLDNRMQVNEYFCLAAEVSFGNPLSSFQILFMADKEGIYCNTVSLNTTLIFHYLTENGEIISTDPLVVREDGVDFGVMKLDPCPKLCDEFPKDFPISVLNGINTDTTGAPPQNDPNSVTISWSVADCENASGELVMRIAPISPFGLPTIHTIAADAAPTLDLTLITNTQYIVSILDAQTGSVAGTTAFIADDEVDLGVINPSTGRINGADLELQGRIQNCDGGVGDLQLSFSRLNGEVIQAVRTRADGGFSLSASACESRYTSLSIPTPQGEQVMAIDLDGPQDFIAVDLCGAEDGYYWKATIAGVPISYVVASGRAGRSGWAAYASQTPNQDAPFFSLRHADAVTGLGTYDVGPDEDLWFEALRLGPWDLSRTSATVEGQFTITEYGDVAEGKFVGTATVGTNEPVAFEVETRFFRP